MRRFLIAGIAAAGASSALAGGMFDDFEGYADTAAMLAEWSDAGVPATGTALNTDSSQYLFSPGGAVAAREFPALNVASGPIIWEGDIIDDGAGNKRVTMGLRDNGGGAPLLALLEMGRYNAFTTGAGYGVRTVFLPGSTNWVQFEGVVVTAGRHHMRATINENDILFEFDLFDDGIVDDSLIVPAVSTGINYNIFRLGGPSGLSSAGGGLGFDDVSITPEPTSLALLGLGGLLALRRRG